MVKYKMFGIIWMFIFSLPKIFPFATTKAENLSTPDESIAEDSKDDKKVNFDSAFKYIQVEASVYFPVESQTDDTPLITADGSRIKEKKPSKHKWIAVSRNLLSRWGGPINYGDTLRVEGISNKLDGPYIVRDTMKKTIRNRIDLLVGEHENIMGYWEDVKIYHSN